MEVSEIVKELEYIRDGHLSQAAIAAALEKREEITPIFLDALVSAKTDFQKIMDDPDYNMYIWAMLFCAYWREKRAYEPIVDFFAMPGDDTLEATGDIVTETLPKILAGVSCGDLSLIKTLVENENLNEYVRSSALGAITTLVNCGDVTRDEAVEYFRFLMNEKLLRQSYDDMWAHVVCEASDIYPEELMPEIRAAFENELVDESYIDLDWVKKTLAGGKEEALKKLSEDSHKSLITDIAREVSWWECFSEKKFEPQPKKEYKYTGNAGTTQPVIRKYLPGRNDPCPCGSGKKYKKCCINK